MITYKKPESHYFIYISACLIGGIIGSICYLG